MRFDKLSAYIFVVLIFVSCESEVGSSLADGAGTGQGGSMTRFSIQGNRMYVVDHAAIKVFDISNDNFKQINEKNVGIGLETIFAKGEYLYLGANDAMYIYSLTDPDSPTFIFRYSHIVSCDPVVVQGNRAYVTLRSGTACNAGSNALEIIDITNPYSPQLIANYPMDSPHGLAVDNTTLFICEGERGLKVFDITDELNIKLTQSFTDFFAYDVIARQGLATITGEDGIFQYSYGNHQIQLLSKIPVAREDF
ncbi:MAG TPA: hypothetical protein VGD65_07450 [Chryseosolibacter sp.]